MDISTRGELVCDRHGIRIQFSKDLCDLWNWFVLKETGKILNTPLRSSKIGLHRYNYKPHSSNPVQGVLRKMVGKKFHIKFEPKNIQIVYSKRKWYWVSFINVDDPMVWNLIEVLGLEKNFSPKKNINMDKQWLYNIPHMSISNGKYIKQLKDNKSAEWFWDNQFTRYN